MLSDFRRNRITGRVTSCCHFYQYVRPQLSLDVSLALPPCPLKDPADHVCQRARRTLGPSEFRQCRVHCSIDRPAGNHCRRKRHTTAPVLGIERLARKKLGGGASMLLRMEPRGSGTASPHLAALRRVAERREERSTHTCEVCHCRSRYPGFAALGSTSPLRLLELLPWVPSVTSRITASRVYRG